MSTTTSDTHGSAPLRWVVGLDLHPEGNGPVEFAKWLADHEPAGEAPQFIGYHVLENSYLFSMLEYHHLAEVVEWSRTEVLKDIDRALASSVFFGLHVVQARNATSGLLDACTHNGALAVVVGRHAPREGRHIVRLGRVPRQTLRRASLPVIVVPPDFTGSNAGSGPVVAATSFSPESADAARFAHRVATSLGRQLVLVHVATPPERHGQRYIPEKTLAILRARAEADAAVRLEAWARSTGLEKARLVVVLGGVVDELTEFATRENACLLAAGAEFMPLWERALGVSIATEIAAHAPCPVAVVPPIAAAEAKVSS